MLMKLLKLLIICKKVIYFISVKLCMKINNSSNCVFLISFDIK